MRRSEENERSAHSQHRHALLIGLRMPDRCDNDGCSTAIGEFLHPRDGISSGGVNDMIGANFACFVQSARVYLGHDDASAALLSRDDVQESHYARTNHNDVIAEPYVGQAR